MRFKFYFVLICFFHVAISHAQQKKVEDPRLQELHALYALRDQYQALIDAGILMSNIQGLTLKDGMIDYLKALDALPGSGRVLVSPTPSKLAQDLRFTVLHILQLQRFMETRKEALQSRIVELEIALFGKPSCEGLISG